jgi:hypothetical protein
LLPVELQDGVVSISTLDDDDPDFPNWIRIGTVERQYLPDPARPYGEAVEAVTMFAGIIALPLGSTVPAQAIPFQDGDVDDWWNPVTPAARFPAQLPLGRLVQLARLKDSLGDSFVLIPPIDLRTYAELTPAEFSLPLRWRDHAGEPAVALRTWRILNSEAVFAEPAALEGSDLIVSPSTFELMCQLCRAPLRELRTVFRQSLTSDSEGDE